MASPKKKQVIQSPISARKKAASQVPNLPIESTYTQWAILLAIILLTVMIRIHLLNIPLDRDEGGYAYTAQLVLKGIPPFAQVYDIKMPGLYYIYALILLIFGQTAAGIHLGLLAINVTTVVMLYFMAKRFFDLTAGIMAAAAYAVMAASWAVQGYSANAEHLLLAPALAGILLMLRGLDCGKKAIFFFSGILLGVSFIIKHQGIFFCGFTAIYLLTQFLTKFKNQRRFCLTRYILFLAGIAMPFISLCLYFRVLGLYDKFQFWMFEYTRAYAARMPFDVGLERCKNAVIAMSHSAILFWILAGIGLGSLFIRKNVRNRIPFILLFLFCSLAAVVPGYHFYPHYFVLALPSLALSAGIGVSAMTSSLFFPRKRKFQIFSQITILMAAIGYALVVEREYMFIMPPSDISHVLFGANPFPEAAPIADYIKSHSRPNDSVAVLGSEPEIYFYADRRSASPYIFAYPLMETREYGAKMQQEMIRDIEAAKPRFIVFANINFSWLMNPNSDMSILNWFQNNVDLNSKDFDPVGLIEIQPDGEAAYHWGNAGELRPATEAWLRVYERRSYETASVHSAENNH
jgi:4-amino-4-deoxy-L-arabinose transferase-like glycosyltransferase